jgi:peroxiredoxin
LAQRRAEFEQHNAQVIVIVSQDQYRISQWQGNPGLPYQILPLYPVLADPLALAAAHYGVARRIMLHEEWVSAPAAFVIDKAGIVRHEYIGRSFSDRVTADALLQALAQLQP